MRQFIIHLFVFTVLASLALALVPKVSSQPKNINILNYSWYIDSLGSFIVVGEIQNNGPNTIAAVFLSGIIYTKDGEAQAYSIGGAFVNHLIPQQKAPFYVEFLPERTSTGDLSWISIGVDRIDLTITQAEIIDSFQYPDLIVQSSSGGVDAEGVYWVTGSVQNSGTQIAKKVRVIATFYNASGTVIAVGYTNPLTPTSLDPSNTASFKVGAFDVNQTGVSTIRKITSYTLLIQVEEPLLSGPAPSLPTSTPIPSDDSPSPNPTESPRSNNSNNSSNSNTIPQEAQYAALIIGVIVVLAGVIVFIKIKKLNLKPKNI